MQTGHDAQLVQYQVMADHRLHFSRLFFYLIAFNLALALAALKVLSEGPPGWTLALCLTGLILLGTAGVSSRLLRQEQRYASAMASIESAGEGFVSVEGAPQWGARRLTVFALGIVGVLIAASSLFAVR